MALAEAKIKIGIDRKQLAKELAASRMAVKQAQIKMNQARVQAISKAAEKIKKKLAEAGRKGGSEFASNFMASLQGVVGPRISAMMGGIKSFIGKIPPQVMVAVAAIAAGIAAVTAAWKLATKSLTQYIEHGRLLNRINSVLKITGNQVGFTSERIRTMTRDLSRMGVVSERQLLSAATILTTFTSITGRTFERALKITGSIARAMGVDARTAALQLGKALQDPATGLATLRESGIAFTTQQRELILSLQKSGQLLKAQTSILQIMKENGIEDNITATATLSDQWDRLTNSSQQLFTAVGKFTGAATNAQGIVGGLADVVGDLSDAIDGVNLAADGIGTALNTLSQFSSTLNSLRGAKDVLGEIAGAFRDIGRAANLSNDGLTRRLSDAKNLSIEAANLAAQAADKIAAKEKSIADTKQRRIERQALRERAIGNNKLRAIEKQIEATREARKKFEGGAKEKAELKFLDEEDEARKQDIKNIDAQIRAERKRKDEMASATSTKDVQKKRIQDRIKAINEEKKAAKQAILDKLEAAKKAEQAHGEIIRKRREALKEELKERKEEERRAEDDKLKELQGKAAAAQKLIDKAVEEGLQGIDLQNLKQELLTNLEGAVDALKGKFREITLGVGLGGEQTAEERKRALRDIELMKKQIETVREEAGKVGLNVGGLGELEKRLAAAKRKAEKTPIKENVNALKENTSALGAVVKALAVGVPGLSVFL